MERWFRCTLDADDNGVPNAFGGTFTPDNSHHKTFTHVTTAVTQIGSFWKFIPSIDKATFSDWAGNKGNGSTTSGTHPETNSPSVETIQLFPATNPLDHTSSVRIIFSEAVVGFDITDITSASGTMSNLQKLFSKSYTAIFTPHASISNSDNYITVSQNLSLIHI